MSSFASVESRTGPPASVKRRIGRVKDEDNVTEVQRATTLTNWKRRCRSNSSRCPLTLNLHQADMIKTSQQKIKVNGSHGSPIHSLCTHEDLSIGLHNEKINPNDLKVAGDTTIVFPQKWDTGNYDELLWTHFALLPRTASRLTLEITKTAFGPRMGYSSTPNNWFTGCEKPSKNRIISLLFHQAHTHMTTQQLLAQLYQSPL